MLEPVQGEAGVVIPPDGFLRRAAELCDARRVLDGRGYLGRSGRTFACEHEDVVPDVSPAKDSAAASSGVRGRGRRGGALRGVRAWSHGSTFGGNPLGAAIGREVVALLDGELQANAARLGQVLERGCGRCRPRRPGGAVPRAVGVDVDPG